LGKSGGLKPVAGSIATPRAKGQRGYPHVVSLYRACPASRLASPGGILSIVSIRAVRVQVKTIQRETTQQIKQIKTSGQGAYAMADTVVERSEQSGDAKKHRPTLPTVTDL
jgi:hypothetical protein